MSLTIRSDPGWAMDEELTPDSASCQSGAAWFTRGSLQKSTENANQRFSFDLWTIREARWEGLLGGVGGHRRLRAPSWYFQDPGESS